MFAQWDDHEVTNDWCPGVPLGWGGYADKSMLQLAARGCRAFHEFMPMRQTQAEAGRIYRKIPYGPLLDVFLLDMRSYRTPIGDGEAPDDAGHILGPTQAAWLKRELMRSQATWKVIAADLPIGVVSGDAVAQGDGPPRGREIEIADLLAFIKHAGIRNTVWLTADMHYTAAQLLRSRTGPCSRTSSRSGNSSPGRCTPAPSAPRQARQHLRPARGVREGLQQASRTRTWRPASACSSSATSPSTARPR